MTFKHEWDERMNGEPNYFYDLLPDLQKEIMEKVYRSCFNECMKQLLTEEIMLYMPFNGRRYRSSYKTISLVPWSCSNGCWFQRMTNGTNRITEELNNDLKDYLKANGFKVTTKMRKIELVRMCLSF
jgi:hypothetical protein